jgi:protein transport protein SEC39
VATHSLSFYSLTLQHGVPFQPVSIRVHQDPIDLVGKVLEQNRKSYTKLDDLLSIGRNLVNAGLPNPPDKAFADVQPSPAKHEEAPLNTERRIISLAISAALNENDFGTAYSYITTRLSPQQGTMPSNLSNGTLKTPSIDDISWRAAYNAGRYRPTSNTVLTSTQQLQTLTQRLELLSLSLILAPRPHLPEILASWRRCDEEMSILRAREAEEETAWDEYGDKRAPVRDAATLPGAFSVGDSPILAQKSRPPERGGYDEEAPMGLFDVARGAARAFGKTAFPLRGANTTVGATGQVGEVGEGRTSQEGSDRGDGAGSGGEGRVRKRDMVSNMVTGGLASGIGWVLGAQPVNQNQKQ